MIQCVLCEDWFHGTHLGKFKTFKDLKNTLHALKSYNFLNLVYFLSFSGLTKEELDSDNFEELICGLCLNREDVKFIRKYSIANKDIIKSSDTCKLPREDNTGQTEGSIFREWFLQIYNYE